MIKRVIFFVLFCILFYPGQSQVYKTLKAKLSFVSDAPLEVIKASNHKVAGILDTRTQQFSFKANMKNFEGFNSPLQKEHFFENYMETDQYPESSFTGKIIEPLTMKGRQVVRAKGLLTVHGISNEVLIEVTLEWTPKGLAFQSDFVILLDDYNIHVPRIVSQKIAKEIKLKCKGSLEG
jgi:polyisoprenoid-binding protein YceI